MGQYLSKKEFMKQNDEPMWIIHNQNNLIDKVLHEKKFNLYSITQFGEFGPIINIKFPPMKTEYSVKILKQECIGQEELEWYNLYNDHIHSLITIEFLETAQVFLFYTEDWNYNLKEMTDNKLLQRHKDGIKRALKWVRQVADGLKYIHVKKFFHLNITTENVVITESDDAKITNFHWLCSRRAFNKK